MGWHSLHGEGNSKPLQYSWPRKSHGRRSLVGCSPWGCYKLGTTEWLHFHFSLSCIGEGNGNPLQCYCLENPRDGGAWWAAVYGVAQSQTWLKRLSSSRSSSSLYENESESCSVMSNSVRPHRRQPTRLPRPWDSPRKNTGVGCHCLLQCRKVKSESEVAQSCPTLSDPMDCSLPGSSVRGILQARVLEWGAIAFSAEDAGDHESKKQWEWVFAHSQEENRGFSPAITWISLKANSTPEPPDKSPGWFFIQWKPGQRIQYYHS